MIFGLLSQYLSPHIVVDLVSQVFWTVFGQILSMNIVQIVFCLVLLINHILLNGRKCLLRMELLSGLMWWVVFSLVSIGSICMVPHSPGHLLVLPILSIWINECILVAILGHEGACGTHGAMHSESLRLPMEALDLQLVILDVKVLDKVLKHISAFTHQLCGLLISEHFADVVVWLLKVGEQ